MKTISHLKRYAVAALLASSVTVAIADENIDTTVAAEPDAQLDDRYGAIAGIVAMWEPTWGENKGWKEELTVALQAASDEQLLAIQGATNYDAIRAILQGQSAPVSLDGVAGTEDLGDLSADLVYTPVFPCRIFDTRNVGAAPVNNEVRNYYTHSFGSLAAQGGNPAGCPPPNNEPVGVSINLAAVPISSVGHLRVYPYLGTLPTASFVNYFGGGNIANSGLITNCFLCGLDISVFNRNTAHSFADVMGYFYPAVIPVNSIGMSEIDSANLNSGQNYVSGSLLVAGFNYQMAFSSFTASATGKCLVTATGQIWKDSTDTDSGSFFRTARQVGVDAPTNDGTSGQYTTSITGQSRTPPITASAVWDVTGGTSYKFGCMTYGSGDLIGESPSCRVSWMCY